uniref:Plasma membrane ATPase 4 n=1 Tax=Rhizophora mucronata TaxID=61149 RepID=A0A2P2PSW7_RHIMU
MRSKSTDSFLISSRLIFAFAIFLLLPLSHPATKTKKSFNL